jgi:hypothetical protein
MNLSLCLGAREMAVGWSDEGDGAGVGVEAERDDHV